MNDAQTFDKIKLNIKKHFVSRDGCPKEHLSQMSDDGSFRDLDYITQNWTVWGPYIHICRIKKFCSIYAAESNLYYQSKELSKAIHKGLAFFFAGDFRSDNWWMGDVGVPIECGQIRLLFKEELTEDEAEKLLILAKGNPDKPRGFTFNSNPRLDALRPFKSQGMHMISQLVDTHIQLTVEDAEAKYAMEKIRDCVNALNIEFTTITYPAGRSPSHLYEDEHCIKTDYSYHEHENEMVHNTYGMGVIEHMSELLTFWRDTEIKLSDEAEKQFINLLLDGYALLRFKCASPMMLMGRDAANADKPTYRRQEHIAAIKITCDCLLQSGVSYRREELEAWRSRIYEPDKTEHVCRTKYFWQSDLLSHNRGNYQFAVHGVSNRMKRPESILGKNVQGMFLGDGSYSLMQTGYEYEGIAPVMDWRKIPGTTVTCAGVDLNPECEIDTKIDTLRIFGGAKGTTSFVGGISDEAYGFMAMKYSHINVKARKSWFCFDEGVVCLGAGISSENDKGVFTTVNQCNLIGEVIVNGRKKESGKHILSECRYVLADGLGYLFLDNTENIYLANETRTGAWSLVDVQSGSDEPVLRNIFLLGIDHGKHPENEKYAYMLLPEMDEAKLKAMSENPTVVILENTAECQAVWDKEIKQLQAVMYSAGTVKTESFSLSVDKPCALMLKMVGRGYRLWLSNPEHEAAEIKVTLNGEIECEITFHLEEGYMYNNLGRPLCYDSSKGFLPYCGAQGE